MGDIFVYVVAGVFLASGLKLLIDVFLRMRNFTETAEAVVVDYKEETHYDSDTMTDSVSYTPVFSFMTTRGEVTAPGAMGTGRMKYGIGERVMIRYNPEDTKRVCAPSDNRNGMLIGLLFVVLAVVVPVLNSLR